MDVINLLVGINLFVSISANLSGAKKGLKSSVSEVLDRPKTYLQKLPLNTSAVILVLEILGVFKIGTYSPELENSFFSVRIVGLVLFIVFSWLQVWSYRTLGKNYSQEVVVTKKQQLVKNGPYMYIRHPQYISQIISDIGAGIALMGYLVLPAALLVMAPLFIMRAILEEKLLVKRFGEEFENYRAKTRFVIPFIG